MTVELIAARVYVPLSLWKVKIQFMNSFLRTSKSQVVTSFLEILNQLIGGGDWLLIGEFIGKITHDWEAESLLIPIRTVSALSVGTPAFVDSTVWNIKDYNQSKKLIFITKSDTKSGRKSLAPDEAHGLRLTLANQIVVADITPSVWVHVVVLSIFQISHTSFLIKTSRPSSMMTNDTSWCRMLC